MTADPYLLDFPRPKDPVNDWAALLTGTWSWQWVPPIFPSSGSVRIADMDGWVEQNGHILLLDGLVGSPGAWKPSQAVRIAVRQNRTVTWLGLACPEDAFDKDTHVPHRISHYHLLAGPFKSTYLTWDRWVPLPGHGHWKAVAVISMWAAWACMQPGADS